ncbi:MAG: hypothetical protein JWM43_2967 [Acidobacteriaceae bacterium]|nr:hypothetical protein [Acidobacteriaceae bacterium]
MFPSFFRSMAWLGVAVLGVGTGYAQQQDLKAREIVRVAMQVELDASRDDHSHWAYKDIYKGASGEKVMRVVETGQGALKKKVEENGRVLTPEELKAEDERLQSFVKDPAQQAKQHRDNAQDDKRAESMLRMLPEAFLWKVNSDDGKVVTLGFVPNPGFEPPTMESRVFAAMAGEIVVDKEQHRIQTIRGKLTDDVKFGFGLFGRMKEGGTFEIERRQLASGIWQITESHVHIDGKALLFKTIGEQEDDVKSEFRRVPQQETLEEAANRLKGEPASLSAAR